MENADTIASEACGAGADINRDLMRDDSEERRAQDKRDFEFYRSRIKPTCADLWRISEKSSKFNDLSAPSQSDELIWSLLASAVAFLLLASAGMIDRAASILP